MKTARNPARHMMSPARGGMGTTIGPGKFVRGPAKGRVGKAGAGKLKRRRYGKKR